MPGLRGRPRKPTAIHLVKGNPGRRPLPKGEPKPEQGDPAKPPPVARDAVASAEWDRLVANTTLKHARVLTKQDGQMLEATARAYSEYEAADVALREAGGLTYESTTPSGGVIVRSRPEVTIRADAWRRWVSGLTHFGLSPATRGKVQAIDAGKPTNNLEDEFFGGGR
jgi:P27 family predicted phage terminase small subunit